MKTRSILIVAIVILVAAVIVGGIGTKSAMKGGRLHHWLVTHDIQRTGIFKGQKVRSWISDYCFQTADYKVYEILPDGTVRRAQWKPVLDPALWVVPQKSIIIPTNRPRDPNFVAG